MSTIQELLNLSNQMLRMNWNDENRRLGSRQAINLNKVVRDIKDVMELTANAKGCRLIMTVDATLPPILTANGLHLQCLLIYLLNNLIQHSRQNDKIILHITTEQLLKDRKIVLLITIDHSSKKLPEDIDFQIIDQFVQALGGKVKKQTESLPLISFTASFTIPLLDTIMASLRSTQRETEAKASALYKVLLVEDHLLAQFAAEHTLSGFQCAVDVARTGKEALQKTKQQQYDVIFMDLGLPDGRGVTFAQKISTQTKGLNRTTPIVAITAHATAEERNQCKEIGMYTVVHKPLSIEAVTKIFKTLAESRADSAVAINLEEPKPKEKPAIDLILGAELVDSDIRKAQSMLAIFIYLLSDAQHAIQKAYYAKDIQNLVDEVHKLYGAACYCGVPRLIESLYSLETALKSNKYHNIAPLYEGLMKEIQRLMDEYEPSGF